MSSGRAKGESTGSVTWKLEDLGGGVQPMDPELFGQTADQAVKEAERHGPGASRRPIVCDQAGDWIVGPQYSFRSDRRSFLAGRLVVAVMEL